MSFSYRRKVQFADTDMAGVMHFSNYFRVMEEAETAFWRSLGMKVHLDGDERKFSWPRVSVACDYRSPAFFEDEIEVRVLVSALGEKSVTFEFELRRAAAALALGRMTAVCCEVAEGRFRAIAIPPTVRDRLAAALPAGPVAPHFEGGRPAPGYPGVAGE